MKLNEKMTKALNSSIHVKRIALKISKELSIDRAQRVTEGVAFLNECFTDFNNAIESGNPLEKSVENFLALSPRRIPKPGSLVSIAASLMTPRGGSGSDSPKTFHMSEQPRIQTLWEKLRAGAEETPSNSSGVQEEV
jgi:hypothetical protein